LRAGAALHEQHLVVARDAEQFAQIRLGLGGHLDEGLAAMADFHDRHAAAVPVENSSRACAITSSGNAAGPGEKLKTAWRC
jgi:hypothetical protein